MTDELKGLNDPIGALSFLYVINAGGAPSIQEGLLASRPPAGTSGRLYLATDQGILYRDDGTEWVALQLGPTGATGATGTAGSGAIIPLSSGSPISITSIAGGLAGIPGFVGFGNSAPGLSDLGPTIDLTGSSGTLLNFAFSAPATAQSLRSLHFLARQPHYPLSDQQ